MSNTAAAATDVAESAAPSPTSPTKSGSEGAFAKELECAICQSVMIDPRVLACQHAFCHRCLFGVAKRDRGCGLTIECPFRCAEATRLSGDIRTLRKNTMLANLCVRLRKSAFDRKALDACDWCLGDNSAKALTFCDRCGAVMCGTCSTSPKCDHGFLCSAPIGRLLTPVLVQPNYLAPRAGLQVAQKQFAEFKSSATGRDAVSLESIQVSASSQALPETRYVRGQVFDVQVNAADVAGVMSVVVLPGNDLEALEPGMAQHAALQTAGVPLEPSLLFECSNFAGALEDFSGAIVKLVSALRRVVLHCRHDITVDGPRCVRSLRHVLAVACATDAAVASARLQFIPVLRQTIVMAHLLGLERVGKLKILAAESDDRVERRAFAKNIAIECGLNLTLGAAAHQGLERALNMLQLADDEVSDLTLLAIANTTPPSSSSSSPSAQVDNIPPGEPITPVGDHVATPLSDTVDQYGAGRDGMSLVTERIAETLTDMMNAARAFQLVSDAAFDRVLESPLVGDDNRDHFASLRSRLKELREHGKLVCYSWTAATGIASVFKQGLPAEAALPLSVADPLTPEQQEVVDGVNGLIDSLLPQISAFREQHLQLVTGPGMEARQEPEAAVQLQAQLTQLMLQAIDLFGKDEVMRAQAFAALFHRVKSVETMITSSISRRPDRSAVSDSIVNVADTNRVEQAFGIIGQVSSEALCVAASDSLFDALRVATQRFCNLWIPIVASSAGASNDLSTVLHAARVVEPCGSDVAAMGRDGAAKSSFVHGVSVVHPQKRFAIQGELPTSEAAASEPKQRAAKLAAAAFGALANVPVAKLRTSLVSGAPSAYVMVPILSGHLVLTGIAKSWMLESGAAVCVDDDEGTCCTAFDVSGNNAAALLEDVPVTRLLNLVTDASDWLRRTQTFTAACMVIVGYTVGEGLLRRFA